jgi:hypothetical protein
LLLFFALTMTYDINWAAAGVDSAISTWKWSTKGWIGLIIALIYFGS